MKSETLSGSEVLESCSRITMPEDKRGEIEKKLAEYESRLDGMRRVAGIRRSTSPFRAPEHGLGLVGKIPWKQLGSVYKIAIARELLQHGEVDTHALSRRLAEEHGGFSADRFNNSCAVLESYCKQNGPDEF